MCTPPPPPPTTVIVFFPSADMSRMENKQLCSEIALIFNTTRLNSWSHVLSVLPVRLSLHFIPLCLPPFCWLYIFAAYPADACHVLWPQLLAADWLIKTLTVLQPNRHQYPLQTEVFRMGSAIITFLLSPGPSVNPPHPTPPTCSPSVAWTRPVMVLHYRVLEECQQLYQTSLHTSRLEISKGKKYV